jgi:hypothetical protein
MAVKFILCRERRRRFSGQGVGRKARLAYALIAERTMDPAEHLSSELPQTADFARCSRHVAKVPILLQKSVAADVAVDHFAMSGRL